MYEKKVWDTRVKIFIYTVCDWDINELCDR